MTPARELPRCLRCGPSLNESGTTESINFWTCPACARRFAQRDGGDLTERWGGALSLVLYGVIFTDRPQERAAFIARRLDHLDRDWLVSEIEDELRNPSQSVRDILDLPASEEDLREFLALVARELRVR